MNAEELKRLQFPLKSRYKADPDSAVVTLRAEGKPGEGITCKIDTHRAMVEAGLHPASGGSGELACSGDLLLEALVACAGVTLKAVATSTGIQIKDATIKAEGDIDFRGTLGVNRQARVGFKDIRLQFIVDSDASPEKLAKLLELTERYCVILQTLKHGVDPETKISGSSTSY